MELKRILARDSRSANEKAIQLYGKEVLIISSQRLDNQTELIVAVDLDALGPTSAVSKSAPGLSASQPSNPIEPDPLVSSDVGAANEVPFVPFSKLFQSASAFAPLPSDAAPIGSSDPVALTATNSAAPSVPNMTPTLASESALQQARHDHLRNQEIVEMMRLEMAALRKEFSLSRQMMPWQDGLRLSPAVQQLSMAMSEAGVPAGLRALLTDAIEGMDSEQEALPVMHGLLVNAMSRAVVAIPASGVHALCGPSGAGKTLMVGRLALAAAQTHGAENQVMVSFADQRPGAWAQMQLLAAQSGVACYRAADSDMLRMLLEDLGGKTIWIDTCGTDFSAQAQLLLEQHPSVLRHAVLPVDATVTSVQKILQNPGLPWSTLMLSKVDEAAYPWALIKGLTEHSLPVSCMADSGRMVQSPVSFDAERLVSLALVAVQTTAVCVIKSPTLKPSAMRPESPQLETSEGFNAEIKDACCVNLGVNALSNQKSPISLQNAHSVLKSAAKEEIMIPTLFDFVPMSTLPNNMANVSGILKVTHE